MSGHSYKGRRNPPNPAPLPAAGPVITSNTSTTATFTWPGTDPDQWGLYDINAPTPGNEIWTADGTDRSIMTSGTGGEILFIRGVDATFSVFQTPASATFIGA